MRTLLMLLMVVGCKSDAPTPKAGSAAGSGGAVEKPKGPTPRTFHAKPAGGAIVTDATPIVDALATDKVAFDTKYTSKAVTVTGMTETLSIETDYVRMSTPKGVVECKLASGDPDREPLHLIAEAAGKKIQVTITGTVQAGLMDDPKTHTPIVLVDPCGIVQAIPAY